MSQKQLGTDGRYRRILRNFGGDGSIQGIEDVPVDVSIDDAKALGAASLVGFALVAAVPRDYQLVGWIGAGVLVALAALACYVAPADRAPLEWLGAIGRFKKDPKRLTAHAESPRERTQNLTRMDGVLPICGAVRRRDGTLVSAVKVEGRDMALAETDEWDQAAKGFEDLAGAVDGGFEIYSPAQVVISHALVRGYRGRERDEDVEGNETLQSLVETYQEELPREFRNRGTAVRDFYVLVWVSESEVRRQDHGVLAKLADLRGIGGVVSRVGLARRGPSDAEIETRQKSILEGRKRAVETAVSSIEGCEASAVDAEHLTALLQEYWTGRRCDREGKPVPRHRHPVVTRGQTADESNPSETGGY